MYGSGLHVVRQDRREHRAVRPSGQGTSSGKSRVKRPPTAGRAQLVVEYAPYGAFLPGERQMMGALVANGVHRRSKNPCGSPVPARRRIDISFRREKFIPLRQAVPQRWQWWKGWGCLSPWLDPQATTTAGSWRYQKQCQGRVAASMDWAKDQHGKTGDDRIIKVPVGALIRDAGTGRG